MKITPNVAYYHYKDAELMINSSAGATAQLEVSNDNENWSVAGTIPLAGGEQQARVYIRNCWYRFVNVTGDVWVTPDPRSEA